MLEFGLQILPACFIINCLLAGAALSQELYGSFVLSALVALLNGLAYNLGKKVKAARELKDKQ